MGRWLRHAWMLNVYFLAASFDRAMKKLEEALDFLQRQEDKLWFWGVERAEDMGFSAEFLRQAGMRLDRRNEFPKRATSVTLAPEREVPASVLGPMRRRSRRLKRQLTVYSSPLTVPDKPKGPRRDPSLRSRSRTGQGLRLRSG